MAKKTEQVEVEEVAPKVKKLDGVQIGATVHYAQSGGESSVAFITRVHNAETGMVNLYVIQDGVVRATWYVDSVRYSSEGEAGTWRFIPKA